MSESTDTFVPDVYVDVPLERYQAWITAGRPVEGANALPAGAIPISAAGLNRLGQALQVASQVAGAAATAEALASAQTVLQAGINTKVTATQAQGIAQAAIAAFVGSAPAELDTWPEVVAYLAALSATDSGVAGQLTTLTQQIAAKYTKPSGGIPAADLAAGVIPDTSGLLTKTDAAATYQQVWRANTAFGSGQIVVNPAGQLVSAKQAFTSGATYDAANWNVLSAAGAMTNFVTVVKHGSDANVTRPAGYDVVYWVGTVVPVNAADADLIYDTTTGGGSSGNGAPVDIQVFTAGGTWTKPTAATPTRVHVLCIGAGGGGGSGRRGAAGTLRTGGAGGGGGAFSERWFTPTSLPATVAVTIAGPYLGGASQATDDSNGNAGQGGNANSVPDNNGSFFGVYCRAGAGRGGQAGNATGAAASQGGGPGQFGGGNGASSSATGGGGGNAGDTQQSGSGGGAGGGITTGNAFGTGGGGGRVTVSGRPFSTGAQADGATGTSAVDEPAGTPGLAGGGGASSVAGAGGAGGKGGSYGGGGGGGGASVNGQPSGAGGDGGPGIVIVTTWF